MKKNHVLRSLLVLSSLVLSPGIVLAGNPIHYGVNVFCPYTQTGPNVITNFGSYIAGYGAEDILSQTTQVYFRSTSYVGNVPARLNNYFNESISYDSTTGVVSCNYQSNIPTDPVFSVSYNLTNGLGGAVQSQSSNAISIYFPAGLRG